MISYLLVRIFYCWVNGAAFLLVGPPAAMAAIVGSDCSKVRVALDIGHTLARPGATSALGVSEFSFNQALGRVVAMSLARAGIATTVIGAAGKRRALLERTAEARQAGATLFLSLHHDSVQSLYLNEWQVGGRQLHYSDAFHGYSLFVSTLNSRAQESQRFAALLGAALNATGFTPSLHHAEPIPGENRTVIDPIIGLYRYDNLVVLQSATMPAVLLEAGVIVNRQDELRAQDPVVMRQMADAIALSVQLYCPL